MNFQHNVASLQNVLDDTNNLDWFPYLGGVKNPIPRFRLSLDPNQYSVWQCYRRTKSFSVYEAKIVPANVHYLAHDPHASADISIYHAAYGRGK